MNENYYKEPKEPYNFNENENRTVWEQYNEDEQILLEDDYKTEVQQITDNYNFLSENNYQGIIQIVIGSSMIFIALSILIFMAKCWVFSKIFKRVK